MVLQYSKELGRNTYFLNSKTGALEYTLERCREAMVSKEHTDGAVREFTEFHVNEALKAAADDAWLMDGCDTHGVEIDEATILNAYPLKNIK